MDQPTVFVVCGHQLRLCIGAHGAKKPQLTLQDRVRTGKAMLRQACREQARLGGTPVVQLLAHAVFQTALPQATGLCARIAKRIAHGRGLEFEQGRTDCGRTKHATGGGVVKVTIVRRPHRAAQADHDLKAFDQSVEHLRPAGLRDLGHGQSRGHQHGAGVNNGGAVKVVHLQHIFPAQH